MATSCTELVGNFAAGELLCCHFEGSLSVWGFGTIVAGVGRACQPIVVEDAIDLCTGVHVANDGGNAVVAGVCSCDRADAQAVLHAAEGAVVDIA